MALAILVAPLMTSKSFSVNDAFIALLRTWTSCYPLVKSDYRHQWRSSFLWVAQLTSAGLVSSACMPQKHLVTWHSCCYECQVTNGAPAASARAAGLYRARLLLPVLHR